MEDLIGKLKQRPDLKYLLTANGYGLEFKGKDSKITNSTINGFSINVKAIFYKVENIKALQQLLN